MRLERDRVASDREQAVSDDDQAASDHEQTASDRDLAQGGDRASHRTSRELRQRSSERRRQVSALRDQTATARDAAARAHASHAAQPADDDALGDRDQVLADADQRAADSDQQSSDRDQAAGVHDVRHGGDRGVHQAARVVRDRGTRERQALAQARVEAATRRPSPLRSQSAAISKLTVGVFSDYTGRGPTKARTYIHDDVVTVVLRETLTKAERTLVDNGHAEMVQQTRRTFQDVMAPDLIAAVQTTMQRKVVACLSAHHIDPDYAVQTFILAPEDQPPE